jgi:hypothetical protein
LAGGILIGALSSLVGAQWATALMSAAGSMSVIIMYVAAPRIRLIR